MQWGVWWGLPWLASLVLICKAVVTCRPIRHDEELVMSHLMNAEFVNRQSVANIFVTVSRDMSITIVKYKSWYLIDIKIHQYARRRSVIPGQSGCKSSRARHRALSVDAEHERKQHNTGRRISRLNSQCVPPPPTLRPLCGRSVGCNLRRWRSIRLYHAVKTTSMIAFLCTAYMYFITSTVSLSRFLCFWLTETPPSNEVLLWHHRDCE